MSYISDREQQERDHAERSLNDFTEWFIHRYSNTVEFERDLIRLIRLIYTEAQAPLLHQLGAGYALGINTSSLAIQRPIIP